MASKSKHKNDASKAPLCQISLIFLHVKARIWSDYHLASKFSCKSCNILCSYLKPAWPQQTLRCARHTNLLLVMGFKKTDRRNCARAHSISEHTTKTRYEQCTGTDLGPTPQFFLPILCLSCSGFEHWGGTDLIIQTWSWRHPLASHKLDVCSSLSSFPTASPLTLSSLHFVIHSLTDGGVSGTPHLATCHPSHVFVALIALLHFAFSFLSCFAVGGRVWKTCMLPKDIKGISNSAANCTFFFWYSSSPSSLLLHSVPSLFLSSVFYVFFFFFFFFFFFCLFFA